MANIVFQPPPTYADPVLINPSLKPGQPGYEKFNPIWLNWFLALQQFINANGGGSTVSHNSLAGLQGGSADQFYHLTAAEHSKVETLIAITGLSATITTAKLTSGGANGSMTFVGGLLTAQTPAT